MMQHVHMCTMHYVHHAQCASCIMHSYRVQFLPHRNIVPLSNLCRDPAALSGIVAGSTVPTDSASPPSTGRSSPIGSSIPTIRLTGAHGLAR